jgi:hypothetical protein
MAASHSQDQLSRSLAAGKLRLARSSSSFTLSDQPSLLLDAHSRRSARPRERGGVRFWLRHDRAGRTSLGIAEEGGANGENPALRNPEVSQTCLLAEWARRAKVLVTQAG